MNPLSRILRSIPLYQWAVGLSAAITMIGLLAYLVARWMTPDMGLLYGDLDPNEGSRIVSKLENLGVSFDLRANGSQIFVPRHQIPRVRMNLAEAGLLGLSTTGYELFDKDTTFSANSFVQDVNLTRALEGELARSIATIQGVASVRVHVVFPKKEIFSKNRQEPSAAILLRMKGASRLSSEQVQAVQALVASSISQLRVDRISIVDQQGRLLSKGEASQWDDRRYQQEERLSKTLELLLERSVGVGNVRAQVSIDLHTESRTLQSEHYDPDNSAVRSSQSSTTNEQSRGNSATQASSVSSNVPQASRQSDEESGPEAKNQKTEETFNYEISRTLKTATYSGGDIKRLSVAVLVNYQQDTDKEGKVTSKERSKDELDRWEKLVKSAVGFQKDRGDVVEVIAMPFAEPMVLSSSDDSAHPRPSSWTSMGVTSLLIIALLGLSLFFFKFFLPQWREPGKKDELVAAKHSNTSEEDTVINKTEVTPSEPPSDVDESSYQSLQKTIGQLIQDHPERATAILRAWMEKDA